MWNNFGIKDIFCTLAFPRKQHQKILEGFLPEYESTVTEKLSKAGAIMLGKTNMDEFAMGSSNETSYYGSAINPWITKTNEKLVPGGLRSAVAVSASLCAASIGTDTGGSIRQPASFTGIVGLKTNLWSLFAIWNNCFCIVFRSSWTQDQNGQRRSNCFENYIWTRLKR